MSIDRLNDLLVDAGDAIVALGFTVSAEVVFEHGWLGWKKHGADWEIMVRNSSGDETNLLKTSKKVRVAASSKLPALLEALRVAEERVNGEVLEAIRVVTDFVEHCRRAPKAGTSA